MTMKRKRISNRKRIIRDETDDIFCFCVPLETRFEDFTLRCLGQKLTRKIKLQVCPDCKESYLPGPTVVQMERDIKAKVLAMANERLDVPEEHLYLRYFDDEDFLLIAYNNYEAVRREKDFENDVLYYFDSHNQLARIKILNFYGILQDNHLQENSMKTTVKAENLKENLDLVTEWLDLTKNRVEIPKTWLWIEYQNDADLLYVKLSTSPATISDDDLDNGIVFDYDKNNDLVGIEVWNLYGIYV